MSWPWVLLWLLTRKYAITLNSLLLVVCQFSWISWIVQDQSNLSSYMYVLTTAWDPRIYTFIKIQFFLLPRKLVFTNLNDFTLFKYATTIDYHIQYYLYSFHKVVSVVAVIVWYLELHVQSVPITTNVVSSNLDQGEVYNIMW